MTETNRPGPRMPRGRQTIRKGGSLLGFHGPISKRIRLWTFEGRSNSTVSELERAYFTALESVDRIEERIRRNATTGKLTPEGARADALQFARSELLPGLHRASESISRAKAELAQRKLTSGHDFNAQRVDETDELQQALRPRSQRWKQPAKKCELRQASSTNETSMIARPG
jgi:hypothetical protein